VLRNNFPLRLASQSPRRQQLLRQLGLDFEVVDAAIEESRRPAERPDGFVRRMAREKAGAAALNHPDDWILAADTIVVRDGRVLGKPENPAAARRMLASLAGRWHRVLTAFTLKHAALGLEFTELDACRVKLAALDISTITAYVAGGEPLDKAGAYALQGVGGAFVEAIDGCPTTVIGLPLPLVVRRLRACGVIASAEGRGLSEPGVEQ